VKYDFFPIEATRRTVSRCGRFWDMHDKSELLRMEEDESTHRYTDRLARAAAEFFREHLSVRTEPAAADQSPLTPLPVERLLCTSSGQVVQSLPDAKTVHDEIISRCGQLKRIRNGERSDGTKREALDWLREKVTGPRQRCDLNVRRIHAGEADGMSVEYRLWWSQSGIMNSGYMFRSEGAEQTGRRPVTVGVWPGGTSRLAEHWTWIRDTCVKGRDVLVLNSSGVGPHEPYAIYGKPVHPFFGVIHKLTDDLIWLGDSLAAMRAYDVIRCIDMIGHVDHAGNEAFTVDFHVAGRQHLVVQLAAALDARVAQVTSDSPLQSISDWVISEQYEEDDVMSVVMPGLLNYYDPGEH
jgi:hypothetical protein